MAQFDAAAGITKAGLNQVISQLFANPIAKEKIFQDSSTQQFDPFGTVTLSFSIDAAPTVDLVAPTDDLWNKAVNPGKIPKPTANAFQLLFSDITGSAKLNDD